MKWHIKEGFGYGTGTLCGRKATLRWSGETDLKQGWLPLTVPSFHYCNDCAKRFNERITK